MFERQILRAEITRARDTATLARNAIGMPAENVGLSDEVFERLEASILGLLRAYKMAIGSNIESKVDIEKIVWRVITMEKKLESIELLPDVITDPLCDAELVQEIDKVWKEVTARKF